MSTPARRVITWMELRIPAGQQIFTREGCSGCHTPPLYTNNKLTLAEGFTPLPNTLVFSTSLGSLSAPIRASP